MWTGGQGGGRFVKASFTLMMPTAGEQVAVEVMTDVHGDKLDHFKPVVLLPYWIHCRLGGTPGCTPDRIR